MILPPGITGFFEHAPGVAPPAIDPKLFRRLCHEIAVAGSGRASECESVGTSNHCSAILHFSRSSFKLICNAHYPWVAFAFAGDETTGRYEFLEPSEPSLRIGKLLGFHFIPPAYLESPPDPETIRNLNPAEQQQIRYWRPRRIGDILFNFWD